MKTTILLLVATLLLCGCGESERRKAIENDPWSSAERLIQKEVTNDIVGYYRTVNIYVKHQTDYPSNWIAEARVEYYTKRGGVDRTNVYYRCLDTNIWVMDHWRYWKELKEQWAQEEREREERDAERKKQQADAVAEPLQPSLDEITAASA